MNHTHSLTDWAAALSAATGGYASFSAVYFLLVDAHRSDFDPRPAARRALHAAHQGAVHAGHDLNRAVATSQRLTNQALRDAAVTVAALLALLFPAAGGTR